MKIRQVIPRQRCIDQEARHAAAGSAATGRGWREFVVSVEAVNPGIDLLGGHQPASGNVGAGLGDHPGLPGESSQLFGVGLDGFVTGGHDVVHTRQHNVGGSRLPV